MKKLTEEKDENGKQKHKVVVLEAAILVEAGWTKAVDKIWVFKVDPEIAKQRIVERNGLTSGLFD
jgi:dephospho-CoA kinase